jgi:hypothetical protein
MTERARSILFTVYREKHLIAASLLAFSATALTNAASPTTLCETDEQVLFDCAIESKQKKFSVCARGDLTSDTGELRYRYGKPGRIELTYPELATSGTSADHTEAYCYCIFSSPCTSSASNSRNCPRRSLPSTVS